MNSYYMRLAREFQAKTNREYYQKQCGVIILDPRSIYVEIGELKTACIGRMISVLLPGAVVLTEDESEETHIYVVRLHKWGMDMLWADGWRRMIGFGKDEIEIVLGYDEIMRHEEDMR
jgi:hypothetical protein